MSMLEDLDCTIEERKENRLDVPTSAYTIYSTIIMQVTLKLQISCEAKFAADRVYVQLLMPLASTYQKI